MFKFIKNLSKKQISGQRITSFVNTQQASVENCDRKEKFSARDFYDARIAEVISQNKKKATQLKRLGKLGEAIDLLEETISQASPFELRYDADLIKKTANYMTAAHKYVRCLNFLDKYAREQFAQTQQINLIELSSFIMPAFCGCCKNAGLGNNDINVLTNKLHILDLSNQGRFAHIEKRLVFSLKDKDVDNFFHKYQSSLKALSDLNLLIYPDRISQNPALNNFLRDTLRLFETVYKTIFKQMISQADGIQTDKLIM